MIVLEGVAKRYGETVALHGIDVSMAAGHVHTILGENGSGKSTLVKLLSGVVRPDQGTIRIDGQPVELADPAAARQHGIATVFQETLILPDMSIRDNVMLGLDGVVLRKMERAREREVMQLALQGLPSKLIAKQLCLSHRTVEHHRSRLLEKLGVASMAELMRLNYQQALDGSAAPPR